MSNALPTAHLHKNHSGNLHADPLFGLLLATEIIFWDFFVFSLIYFLAKWFLFNLLSTQKFQFSRRNKRLWLVLDGFSGVFRVLRFHMHHQVFCLDVHSSTVGGGLKL